jgi:N-acetylneuraminate lyase
MTHPKLTGLVAATHTPFNADGSLNLSAIERQAAHLLATGVTAAFINGTTGESHSLTLDERLALADRWAAVTRGTPLKLIVHVGANSLRDAATLAAQAQSLNAHAISALAPSYFKPRSIDTLIACCQEITRAAPATAFYYYDIPGMTGVSLSMPDFLAAARLSSPKSAPEKLPTLAGVKFSNPDLLAYQKCLHADAGRFDIPWGTDEYLLAALALGAAGGVGSSYNFAAPIYTRLITAFQKGDLATARTEQYRSVQLIDLLASHGYMPAAKATMTFLGVDVGPARLPHARLTSEQSTQLRGALERLGFFDWLRPS